MPQNPFKNLSLPVSGKQEKEQPPKEEPESTDKSSVPALSNTNEYLVRAVEATTDLTKEQRKELRDYMNKARTGITLLMAPMICSDRCPFLKAKRCPVANAGIKLPATKPCPVEYAIVKQYRDDLAASINVDLGSGGLNAFDAKLLNDLAGIMMMKTRAEAEMADNPDTTIEFTAGFTPKGEAMTRIMTNPRISLYERMCKLEKDLMKELMGTRKAKYDSTGNPDDASCKGAGLFESMDNAARRKRNKEKIIDAEFTVTEDHEEKE